MNSKKKVHNYISYIICDILLGKKTWLWKIYFCTCLLFPVVISCFRFGMFEELKRHAVNDQGVLTPGHRVLCGLGKNANFKSWIQNCSKCHWIKKQIKPFHIHASIICVNSDDNSYKQNC